MADNLFADLIPKKSTSKGLAMAGAAVGGSGFVPKPDLKDFAYKPDGGTKRTATKVPSNAPSKPNVFSDLIPGAEPQYGSFPGLPQDQTAHGLLTPKKRNLAKEFPADTPENQRNAQRYKAAVSVAVSKGLPVPKRPTTQTELNSILDFINQGNQQSDITDEQTATNISREIATKAAGGFDKGVDMAYKGARKMLDVPAQVGAIALSMSDPELAKRIGAKKFESFATVIGNVILAAGSSAYGVAGKLADAGQIAPMGAELVNKDMSPESLAMMGLPLLATTAAGRALFKRLGADPYGKEVAAALQKGSARASIAQSPKAPGVEFRPPRANAPDMPTNPQNVGMSPVGDAVDGTLLDDTGRPLTLYHGTTRSRGGGFTTFLEGPREARLGRTDVASFSDLPDVASGYADGADGMVYPVHLRMRNPFIVGVSKDVSHSGDWIANLKDAGYDGVITDWGEGVGREYTIFDSSQVKSAIKKATTSKPSQTAGGATLPTSPGTTSKGLESLLTNAERQAIYKQRDNPEALKSLIEYYTPHANDPKAAEIIRIANETMQGDAFKAARGQGDNLEEVLRQSIEKAQAAKRGATVVDPLDAELDAIRQRLKAKYAEPEPTPAPVTVPEPIATPTTFTPRELSGYDQGTVPNLREGLKAAPDPVAPKPVPAKKAMPVKATKSVPVKGVAAKPVSENATPNGGKLEDYGDARVIADKVDSAPVAMRRWLYGTKIPYKQNEIEAVRRWMHENNIPMDFEGQKWIDAPTRFMNAWRDHSNVRPIEEIGAIRPDVNDMRDRFRTDYKTVMGADVDGTPMWTDTHSIVVGTPPKGYSLQPDGAATPDLKRVWDSIVGSVGKSKPVKPVAFSKGAEHVKMALISDDGSVIVYVHPGKMKLVEALHPGVEWRAVSESRPIVGIVDGNPVAGIMPMAGSDIDAAVRSMVDASSPSKLQAIDSEIDALKAAQDAKNAKRPTPRKGGRSGAWQRVDAEDWELAGKLAVLYVKKGVATIEEFTANLVRDLGDAIRPHIQELWDAHGPKVKEAEPTGSGTTPPPTPSTATAGVPEPPKPKTALDFAKEASYVARGLKLGADVGALLRQGAEMAVNDPIQWVKSVGTGLSKTDKAKLAKHYQMLEERSINGKKMADVRKSAGLKISSADAEEAFASKLFDKVPVLNKLENFQKAFLDSGRIERFDSFYRKFPDATEKELKQYAAYLNSAMGKSNVSRVPELLEVVMTAPRWTSSRWEMAGRLMASPVTVTKALRGNKAAMQEAKNLGRYAMAMYGALKVAESQGATVEFDPRSSDFLKMRVGEKVFDPTSGVAAPIRTSLRMMLFARGEGSFNANAATELGKVLTNTANPVITTPWGLITQKSLSGFDLDPEERGALVMLPLIANGAMQAWNKDGPASAMIQTGTELVGINSSRYPKSVPKWNKRKGEGTKAQQVLDKIPF